MPQEQEAAGSYDTPGDATLAPTSDKVSRSCNLDEIVSDFILELRILSHELGLGEHSLQRVDSLCQLSAEPGEHLPTVSGFSTTRPVVSLHEPIIAPTDPNVDLATAVSECERAQLTGLPLGISQHVGPDDSSSSGTRTSAFPDTVPDSEVPGAVDEMAPKSMIGEPVPALSAADAPTFRGNAYAGDFGTVTASSVTPPPELPDNPDSASANGRILPDEVQREKVTAGSSPDELGDIDSALRDIVLRRKKKRRFLFLPYWSVFLILVSGSVRDF